MLKNGPTLHKIYMGGKQHVPSLQHHLAELAVRAGLGGEQQKLAVTFTTGTSSAGSGMLRSKESAGVSCASIP